MAGHTGHEVSHYEKENMEISCDRLHGSLSDDLLCDDGKRGI